MGQRRQGAEGFFSLIQVGRITGVTERQLGYWIKTNLLTPQKIGKEWAFVFRDLVMVAMVKYLLDGGVSLQKVRQSVNWLREKMGIEEPLTARLVTDGISIFKVCKQDRDLIEAVDTLKRAGQGVFFVPIGKIIDETKREVKRLKKAA